MNDFGTILFSLGAIVFALVFLFGVLWLINRQKKLTRVLTNVEEVKNRVAAARGLGEQGIPALVKMLHPGSLAGIAPKRKLAKISTILILETLLDLSSSTDNSDPNLVKWIAGATMAPLEQNNIIRIIRQSDARKDSDEEEFQLNVKLARLLTTLAHRFGPETRFKDLGEHVSGSFFSPPTVGDEKHPSNLRYVIVADEIIKEKGQSEVGIPMLIKSISKEKARWIGGSGLGTMGLGAGLLLAGFGTFLTAFAVTMAENMAKEFASRQATGVKSLLLSPEAIDPQTFNTMPGQARFMIALHAYGTGLAKLAVQYPALIKDEQEKHQSSLEQAVLGFALALNGDLSAQRTLRELSRSEERDDWATKVLAFEGLIALACNDKTANDIEISEQIAALDDPDLRVSTSIAYVMASTQNPIYLPHLAKLAESSEGMLRKAALPALLILARDGDESAHTKLKFMAEQDKDKEIRKDTQKYLLQLQESVS